MTNKFSFHFNLQRLWDKKIIKVFLPGKWSLALFLVVFVIFFAWGTTFDKNHEIREGTINIGDSGFEVVYSNVIPWEPRFYNARTLLMGEVIPLIGQYNLVQWFFTNSLWWGIHYTDLNYSFTDYISVLIKYYCIIITFDAGAFFSLSILRRKIDKDIIINSGSLVLYRSIVIIMIVLMFNTVRMV